MFQNAGEWVALWCRIHPVVMARHTEEKLMTNENIQVAIVAVLVIIVILMTLRAIYGVFAWKGQRKNALLQAILVPIGGIVFTMIIAVVFPATSPERLAEIEAQRTAERALEADVQAEEIAEAETQRTAEALKKVTEYIEQLDREIASIADVQASSYISDVGTINTGLFLIGAWALLYEEGENLELNDDAQKKRQQFRQLLVRKQAELLPQMRDAYGPAMRQQLWEADGSARTIGEGYRTVEFVSATFARNANIKKIHSEVHENLMMLRFTRAQYKWFKQASEYSYFTMEAPTDSDIVKWESGGRFRILD